MNKQEFIKKWANKCDITFKEAEGLFDAFCDTLEAGLHEEGKVSFVGLGCFELRAKKAKTGVSALTGKSYTTSPRKVPAFKAATGFKKKFQ